MLAIIGVYLGLSVAVGTCSFSLEIFCIPGLTIYWGIILLQMHQSMVLHVRQGRHQMTVGIHYIYTKRFWVKREWEVGLEKKYQKPTLMTVGILYTMKTIIGSR